VVDRVTRGFGLEDLLLETLTETDPERGRLKTCTCSLGADCRHVWTYRRSRSSKRGCQDDYLFAFQARRNVEERVVRIRSPTPRRAIMHRSKPRSRI